MSELPTYLDQQYDKNGAIEKGEDNDLYDFLKSTNSLRNNRYFLMKGGFLLDKQRPSLI